MSRAYFTSIVAVSASWEFDGNDMSTSIAAGGVNGGVSTPATNTRDVAGMVGRLFCTAAPITELDLDTRLSIATGGTASFSVGATRTRFYRMNSNFTYEVDPDTFLDIGGAVASPDTSEYGIGGMGERLFIVSNKSGTSVYEIDPDTRLIINSASGGHVGLFGIGGDDNQLWYAWTTGSTGAIFSIDPDTLLEISGLGTVPSSGQHSGITGLKTNSTNGIIPPITGTQLSPIISGIL